MYPKLKKVNHPAAELLISSTVDWSSSPTVLWSWLVFCLETQSVLVVSSSFFTKTLVSKQNFWSLPKQEPTQTNRVTITVPVRCFCGGLLRQFFYRRDCSFTPNVFAHSSTFSWVPCLKTEAWSTAPVQFFLLVEYNKGKTCYRNLVYWQSNLS